MKISKMSMLENQERFLLRGLWSQRAITTTWRLLQNLFMVTGFALVILVSCARRNYILLTGRR